MCCVYMQLGEQLLSQLTSHRSPDIKSVALELINILHCDNIEP